MRQARRAALAAGVAAAVASSTALAFAPTGADFRISNVGMDDDVARNAQTPAVAHNPDQDEYLVVWRGDQQADEEFEIYGQLLDGDGTPIGGDFRISTVGMDGDAARSAEEPDVTYNDFANKYLVVWSGDDVTNDEFEIFGQIIDGVTGTAIVGKEEVPISAVGPVAGDALQPSVTSIPALGQYFVVWAADAGATDGEFEIWGRRFDAAGNSIGVVDTQLSTVDPAGAARDAQLPDVACCSGTGIGTNYLVTWIGDGLMTNNENEVFGQRVDQAGNELGGDFRISNVGMDTDDTRSPFFNALAYSPAADEYLVTFSANNLPNPAESEIWGQRVSGAGAELGIDFRISNLGPDGDIDRDVSDVHDVAYSTVSSEYVVAFHGDGTPQDDENEVFGQRLDTAGNEIGTDFRVSNIGPDADTTRMALQPALAYNGTLNEFLTVFPANNLTNAGEFEIFGHRLAIAPPGSPGSPPPPITPSVPGAAPVAAPAPPAKKKKCKRKKKGAAAAKKCKRRKRG